jgi:hypothetical protein
MESFTIDKLANSGTPMQINGKDWLVTQLTLRDQGSLQAVIRKVQPKPMEHALTVIKGLPAEVVSQILRDARKDMMFWPSPITSQEGLAILFNHEEGQKAVIKAALGRAQVCTDDDVEEIAGQMTYVDFMRLAAIAISGEDPEDDPKA